MLNIHSIYLSTIQTIMKGDYVVSCLKDDSTTASKSVTGKLALLN